jgi:hypothetical protein
VAVPAATPVTRPEEASTVAIVGSLLVQVPPEKVDVKVVVLATHTAWFPPRVTAAGGLVTVIVLVAETLAQPPVPVTVYVMVAVPPLTPVTRPEEASTVAIVGSLLVQEPPGTVEKRLDVPLTHISWFPMRVPAEGGAVTVTIVAAETVEQVGALKITTV